MGVCRLVLLLFLASVLQGQDSVPEVNADSRRVLLLNSYHQGYFWTDEITRGIRETLPDSLVDLTIEYMDTKRQFDSTYQSLLASLLKNKHSRQPYDLILVADDNALDFSLTEGPALFGDTPLVFCGANYLDLRKLEGHSKVTGVSEKGDITGNLDLIRSLHPDCKHVLLITDDTPTGKRVQHEVRRLQAQQQGPLPRIELVYEDCRQDLLSRLEMLEPGSIVLLSFFFRDCEGVFMEYDESARMISDHSAVPVYGIWNFSMGHGIVGGYLTRGFDQGRRAAHMALEILDGKEPSSLPVVQDNPACPVFDYRELVRHDVPMKRLPGDSIILNEPEGFYQIYRRLIWQLLGVFVFLLCILSAVSFGLLRSRKAERKLARSEHNLRVTLDSIGDAVIATDVQGHVRRMNPVAEDLTGWPLKEAKGRKLEEVFAIHDREGRRVRNPVSRIVESGEIVGLVGGTSLLAKDGREFQISDSGAPIRSEAGKIIGVVLVFRDITEELQLQEQLRQSQKLDAIGHLAGGVAHDFNNILGCIVGAADLIAPALGHETQERGYLDLIINSSMRAADLTSKLLAYARKREAGSTPIDLHHALQDAISMLRNTIDKQIEIRTELSARSCTVIGDPSQLQSVFLNLGINAAHAMSKGGTLSFYTRNTSLGERFCAASAFDLDPGQYIEIEVRDTGCGIESRHLSRIFEPFFTTKEQGMGAGLGLSAVFGTVQQHKGAISVTSATGRGSRFHLLLPLTKDAAQVLPDPGELVLGEGSILVVDDESVMRATTKALLQRLGYSVLLAEDGQEAIEIYSEHQDEIDLVLLDMIMPRMNGGECFRQLRQMRPDLPIILSSGFSRPEDISDLKQLGLNGFLRKPYRGTELSHLLAETLSSV